MKYLSDLLIFIKRKFYYYKLVLELFCVFFFQKTIVLVFSVFRKYHQCEFILNIYSFCIILLFTENVQVYMQSYLVKI